MSTPKSRFGMGRLSGGATCALVAGLLVCTVVLAADASGGEPTAAKPSTITTGSGERYRTTVERTREGELSAEDFRQVSLLCSRIALHLNRSATYLEHEHPKKARAEIEKARALAGIVHDLLPTTVVAAVKHKVGGSAMMLSKGVGIRAGGKPVSMYQRRPGWTLGANWYVPNVRGTAEFPHVCVDVNWWKSFIHERLAVAPGDPGALTLFGKKPAEHHLFGEHVSGSETYVTTFGHGRQVQEWRQRPERPDNHWFDCLVGCAAAASREGCVLFGTEGQPGPRRERMRLSDLQARRG